MDLIVYRKHESTRNNNPLVVCAVVCEGRKGPEMYGCNVCCWLLHHSRRALCAQAAASAGKDYEWAVDADNDGADGILLARLLSVVDGCVAPEPTRRLTVPAVLESLTSLKRDVISAVAPTYDVLAILDAMEGLSIDAAVVSVVENAMGTSMTSTLQPLLAKKVPIMQVAAVRRAVAPPHTATNSVRGVQSATWGFVVHCALTTCLV